MGDDSLLAAGHVLRGLEEPGLRVAALAMLFDKDHGAGLQQLALFMSGTDDLADAVKIYLSEHQAGV